MRFEALERALNRIKPLGAVTEPAWSPSNNGGGTLPDGSTWVIFVDTRTGVAYSGVYGTLCYDIAKHTEGQ